MRATEAGAARAVEHASVRRAQTVLEDLYGLEAGPCATGFLETDRRRLTRFAPDLRATDEQLLVRQRGAEMELLLFLDGELLARIARREQHDASTGASRTAPLDAAAIGDRLVLLEGVSHFRYIVDRAGEGRATCLLELELQAEIDKFFVLCLTLAPSRPQSVTGPLWQLQFERARYHPDLAPHESAMYREANRLAARFCRRLLRRYAGRGLDRLLAELRAFRTLGGRAKLAALSA